MERNISETIDKSKLVCYTVLKIVIRYGFEVPAKPILKKGGV